MKTSEDKHLPEAAKSRALRTPLPRVLEISTTLCYDGTVSFWFRLSLRTRVGVISSAFLVAVVVLLFLWFHDPVRFPLQQSAWILCFASLAFLLWLAWSDLERIPWWKWFIILFLLVFCSIKPMVWLVGIPLIGYILFGGQKK